MGRSVTRSGKYKRITKTPAQNKTYVGYCHSPQHKGYITAKILKAHQCTYKEIKDADGNVSMRPCPCLEKYEHVYWRDKERSHLLRKLKNVIVNSTITETELKGICEKHDWKVENISLYLSKRLGREVSI